MNAMVTFGSVFLIVAAWMSGYSVNGHGLMTEPPSRNTMWRLGYSNPKNYDDMGLNCGGFDNQWDVNGGKCGVCGDPYQGPLKHQPGHPGGYANGIIGRVYKAGDFIKVTSKITANHLGYVEFKICPVNDKSKKATQSCLDKYPLKDASGNGKFKIYDYIKNSPGQITVDLKLPSGLTCEQCVIQWTYTAGNNGGQRQETFKNCADVKITVEGGSNPIPQINPLKRRDGGATKTDENNNPIGQYDCDVQDPFNKGDKHQEVYDWCLTQCIEVSPEHRRCPKTHCECYKLDGKSQTYKPSDNYGDKSGSTKTYTTVQPQTTKTAPYSNPSYPTKASPPPRPSYPQITSPPRPSYPQGRSSPYQPDYSQRAPSPRRMSNSQRYTRRRPSSSRRYGGSRYSQPQWGTYRSWAVQSKCRLNSPYDMDEMSSYLLTWCEKVCSDPASASYKNCNEKICDCN